LGQDQNTTIFDTVTKISGHLCKTDAGEHAMLLYDDVTSFRDIYSSHCKKALQGEGNSVMILSHYEVKASVIQTLKEVELDVENRENDGSLIMIDASEILSKSENIVDFLRYLMTAEMAVKKRGKMRLDIIVDMGCFYHLSRVDEIPRFEESISARTNKESTIICCYNSKDFQRMDEGPREKIRSHHMKSFAIVQDG
jgi:hypothetical protein